MSEQKLATTSSEGLRPLGQPELRAFELIADTVRERLSDAHAALFAEPVRTPYGDKTDWYTGLSGKARPLADLSEEEAGRIRSRLSALVNDIKGLAATFAESTDLNEQRLSEALTNALVIPNEQSVWAISVDDAGEGLQPVLIDWASEADTMDDGRNAMSRLTILTKAPAAPKPAPVQPPVAAPVVAASVPAPPPTATTDWKRWIWALLWTLIILLIALILYLLFVACGLRGISFLNFCPTDEIAVVDVQRDNDVLQNRIDQLTRELAALDRSCQPVPTDPMVTLDWDGKADLDVALICPSGEKVWWREKEQLACGATMRFDENAATPDGNPRLQERITLIDPQPGRYGLEVKLFERSDVPGDHNFELNVDFGAGPENFRGSVSRDRPLWQESYEYIE